MRSSRSAKSTRSARSTHSEARSVRSNYSAAASVRSAGSRTGAPYTFSGAGPSRSQSSKSTRRRPATGSSKKSHYANDSRNAPQVSSADEVVLEPEERLNKLAARCKELENDGKMAELITLRIEGLAVARLCFGKSDPEAIQGQCALSRAYLHAGLFRQAVEHGLQCLTSAQQLLMEEVMCECQHILGRALTKLLDYAHAKDHLREALRLSQRNNGRHSHKNCRVLVSIAQLHAAQNEYNRVEDVMKRVVGLEEVPEGESSNDLIDAYLELARSFFAGENDSLCQSNLEQMLQIVSDDQTLELVEDSPYVERLTETSKQDKIKKRKGTKGSDAMKFDFDDDELASALPADRGGGEEAEDDKKESTLPPLKMSWKVADAICLLAASQKRSGACDKAVRQYERAENLYSLLVVAEGKEGVERAVEVARIKVCKIERELATIHIILENYPDAAKHMFEVLKTQLATLPGGRYDIRVARTEQRMGEICSLAGKLKYARHHFIQALHVVNSVLGPKAKATVTLQNRVAAVDALIAESGDDPADDWPPGYDYGNYKGERWVEEEEEDEEEYSDVVTIKQSPRQSAARIESRANDGYDDEFEDAKVLNNTLNRSNSGRSNSSGRSQKKDNYDDDFGSSKRSEPKAANAAAKPATADMNFDMGDLDVGWD